MGTVGGVPSLTSHVTGSGAGREPPRRGFFILARTINFNLVAGSDKCARRNARRFFFSQGPRLRGGFVVMPVLRRADSLTSKARRCWEASVPGDAGLTWSA